MRWTQLPLKKVVQPKLTRRVCPVCGAVDESLGIEAWCQGPPERRHKPAKMIKEGLSTGR